MASTHKHLRSSTANKRPTTSIAEGQIALNTNTTSPGLFFKDSTGATIIKVGPVHVGTTAPNATPPAGGSSGNSTGEVWLDTSLTPNGVKIWNGSAWVNATPVGSTTVQGLLELATDAETQAGSDTARAVTPASLQSKMSDSATTTSATTIASSTAVKTAYDLANAALPKSGGTITGNLEIGTTGSLSFEGSTADGFETTIAVTDPTADRTITLPDTTGTVVTTGDTGTVTSTMIANGTIVDADINASAAIVHSKLANITAGQVLLGNASNVPTATALSGDVTVNSSGVTAISSGVIVNADVSASAAIAGTKISPDFGAQNITTTGTSAAASFIPTSSTVPTNGVYLPAANSVGISTNGSGRLFVDSSGRLGIGTSAPSSILDIKAGSNGVDTLIVRPNTTSNFITFKPETASNQFNFGYWTGSAWGTAILNAETFAVAGASEKLRITSAGLVGIGTSAPSVLLHSVVSSAGVAYRGGHNNTGFDVYVDDSTGEARLVAKRTGGSGGKFMSFYTDTGSGETERARITSGGYFKASNSGTYTSATGTYHEFYQTANAITLWTRNTEANLSTTVYYATAARAANSAFQFFVATSSYGGTADDEFNLRGDGNAFADGSWTGGGADYAEYFEWSDGNPDAEDRRGISVVLDGDKIREALAGEDPIGVISGNPSIVGDAAWNKWSGKYLRDEFGTYILEDYEVTDDDGNTVTQQRRKLNPAYDPDAEYIPREQRPEWDCVGLMGKLRIRKGQITGSRWIKMRDINDLVEEWLVR